MSVIDADLVAYCAADMPEDDVSAVGGAVDLARILVFVQMTVNGYLDVVSDDAGDTDQVYTVTGYDGSGSLVSEDFDIAGLSTVNGAQTFERITKIVKKSGSALAGTLTWTRHTGGSTIVKMESAADAAAGDEVTAVRTIYYGAASDPSVGKVMFEKFFFRNNNGATTLTQAMIRLMDAMSDTATYSSTVDQNSGVGTKVLYVAATAGINSGDAVVINTGGARAEVHEVDSVSAGVSITLIDNLKYTHTSGQADVVSKCKVEFELEDALDGTDTSTDRLTQPAGYAGYTWNAREKYVRGAGGSYNHTAGAVQGVWLKNTVGAADAAVKGTITAKESGLTV
jgi:hypothetical protein